MMNETQQQHPQAQSLPQGQAPQQQQQQQQQQQSYTHHAPSGPPPPMIVTPTWLVAIRGLQFFLAIIILGLSAAIIHWVYMDELGLSVAISLFTWIIVLYALLSEKLPALRRFYHTYAVLALDLFLVILWLATLGATAARRATFVVSVTASCSSDGSAVNSGRCTVLRRYIVMSHGALAMLSAIAGLSALQLILFLATFIWTVVQFVRWRKANAPAAQSGASQGEIQMESKQPFLAQQTAYQQQPSPSPQNGHVQQQQQQQFYPPQQYQQHQQQPPQQYQEMPVQQQQHQQYPQQTPSPAQNYGQQPPQEYQQYQQHQHQQYPAQPYTPSPVNGAVSPANSPPPQGQGYAYPPQELR
ncbi:Putative Marvel domain-containing protein [Colletotrichum destructivum]|uniref:Marvel domain-containing protein n=1 Tax=Colletotrichum destructivum TaxID=34406 RepID=A0AAX4IU79_9PEZI|nr:Putative Marvel domain-containing protein [Colletotrichum destructivum]